MRVNAHRRYSNHSDFYDDGRNNSVARKVKKMAKSKGKTFGYCSACGSRQKIDGVCHACGDTDKAPTAAATSRKSRKRRVKTSKKST